MYTIYYKQDKEFMEGISLLSATNLFNHIVKTLEDEKREELVYIINDRTGNVVRSYGINKYVPYDANWED